MYPCGFSHRFHQKRLNGDRRMMHVSKGKGAEISLMSADHSHSWSVLVAQRTGASNISIHFVMEAAGGCGGRGGKERGEDFRSTQSAHLVVAFDIREFDAELLALG